MKQIFSNFFIVAITAATFFSSCTEQPKPVATFDLASARKDIESVNQDWMNLFSRSDSAAYADIYTTDAEFMGPNTPTITGRKAIESAISDYIKSGLGLGLSIKTTNVWGNESCLAEQGTFTLSTKDGKPAEIGKYIVLWKKENGKWKAFRDCSNSDLPVAAK